MPIADAQKSPLAEGPNKTVPRLIDAGIELIASGGLRALTVRDVAAIAGLSFPAVQYHFPAKADLIEAVLGAVATRHSEILEAVDLGNGRPISGAPALIRVAAMVLSDWCSTHAPLTIAAHEMLLAGYRGHDRSGAAKRWIERQHAAWMTILVNLTGSADADTAWLILELMVGLSVMTLGSGRPVEAGLANEEILRHALDPASAPRPDTAYWYAAFLDGMSEDEPDDLARPDNSSHPAARRILEAGLRIVAEQGSGAVTFRGVAERGEVAVSSITNNFRTRENLLYRIYRWLHDELATASSSILPPPAQPITGSEFERYSAHLRSISAGDAPYFLASYDLVLAAARNPLLSEQAWRMRMTRGIYFLVKSGHMPAPDMILQFRWHIVSLWSIGLGVIHHIRLSDPDTRIATIDGRLKSGLETLPQPS